MAHTDGPWEVRKAATPVDGAYDYGIGAVVDGKHVCIAEAFGRVAVNIRPDAEANARLIAAAPPMLAALREWKCPSCGGKGTYQQNAVGRARDEARGRTPDPAFNPDPVTCKICDGHGLHPTARAAIAEATGVAP